jgi:hypothetical protein
MKRIFLLISALAVTFSAHAKSNDEWLAKQRAVIPAISGGFTFKQFVIAKPGDKEVLGDEGVLYISPRMFTDQQLVSIRKSQQGKNVIYGDPVVANFHLSNTCFSSTRKSPGQAGAAAGYLSLVLAETHNETNKDGIWLRLYTWPDFWYEWHIERTKQGLVVDDSYARQAWGWTGSLVLLVRDPSVNLNTCLNYKGSKKL